MNDSEVSSNTLVYAQEIYESLVLYIGSYFFLV